MSELKSLKLNVVVPTFNRAALLSLTLESLSKAERAPTLDVTVTVVDNNSTDETRQTVEGFIKTASAVKFEYIFEPRQGKSFAINAAIEKSDADLIATLDDDEEVAADWLLEIARLFGSRWEEIDFAGGKVLPRWETEPPPVWISPKWTGIGWRDYGEEEWIFGAETPILCGGHAVLKRKIFDEIGFYNESVGPTGKNLIGCEDDVFFDKLIGAGKRGVYCPRLAIRHFVPDYRLSRNYLRQWCWGNGASQDLADRFYKPFEGARLFNVPRYLYRQAALSVWRTFKARLLRGKRLESVTEERDFWIFCGYFYSRNIQNSRFESSFKFLGGKILAPVNR